MGLCLEESYASVQLRRDGYFLVVLGKQTNKGGVVGTDLADVGVNSVTESWAAIACCLCKGGREDVDEDS